MDINEAVQQIFERQWFDPGAKSNFKRDVKQLSKSGAHKSFPDVFRNTAKSLARSAKRQDAFKQSQSKALG